jgi:hypothetical protein
LPQPAASTRDRHRRDIRQTGQRSDDKRANIGFGTCAAAINKGARNSEAFLYQTRTGQLFFNANGSDPGLGEGGGVIWVFKGAPALGVYFDRTGSGTLPF